MPSSLKGQPQKVAPKGLTLSTAPSLFFRSLFDKINIDDMQFSALQVKTVSKLILDLGKIFFGSVVVGFFIPSLEIPLAVFLSGTAFSLGLFIIGIKLLKSI